jgi:hypothetical protein
MRAWALRRLNGRRGAFLCLFATVYLLIGYSYLSLPSTAARSTAFRWLPDWFPLTYLGWPWIIAGLIAITSSYAYEPPRSDRAGFSAMTAVPLAWSLMFLLLWLAGFAPTGWISASTYAGFAAGVMVVSGWPNPVPIPPLPPIPQVVE